MIKERRVFVISGTAEEQQQHRADLGIEGWRYVRAVHASCMGVDAGEWERQLSADFVPGLKAD